MGDVGAFGDVFWVALKLIERIRPEGPSKRNRPVLDNRNQVRNLRPKVRGERYWSWFGQRVKENEEKERIQRQELERTLIVTLNRIMKIISRKNPHCYLG